MFVSAARPSVLIFLAACASAAPLPQRPAPPAAPSLDLRAVHIDTIAPDKVHAFEAARRDWLTVLQARGATDERGYFIQADNVFFTLHRASSYAQLDDLRAKRRAALSVVPKEALAIYDAKSDACLVPPHSSEIWAHDAEDDYAAPGVGTDERSAGAVRVDIEELDPTPKSQGYDDAWKDIKRALTNAKYPVSRVAFSSVYGSGKVVSLWFVAKGGDLDAAPTIDAAVRASLGAGGDAVLSKWRSAVVDRRSMRGARRPDLDSP